MPPRIAVTFAMPAESRRTAAAVSTGKLDTPESTKTPAARAAAIEGLDAFHEVRSIGQIEIVNALRDTGFDDPIPTLAIILKRPAGVDEDMRLERGKLRGEVAFPVEDRGHEPGLGPVARSCNRRAPVRASGRRWTGPGAARSPAIRRCGLRTCHSRRRSERSGRCSFDESIRMGRIGQVTALPHAKPAQAVARDDFIEPIAHRPRQQTARPTSATTGIPVSRTPAESLPTSTRRDRPRAGCWSHSP